jgi:hypothetical protein
MQKRRKTMRMKSYFPENRYTFLCILLCFIFLISVSCESKKYLYIPVGRLADAGNKISIEIDGHKRHINLIQDIHTGAWYKIPASLLQKKSTVTLIIKKKSKSNTLGKKESSLSTWLKPSIYVDCEHPDIIAKAAELTTGLSGSGDRAMIQAILDFVNRDIQFKLVRGMKKDFKKASQSLRDGYGICMNKARIFVALCRASNIPARVICGVVIDKGEDHHHDWTEVYDREQEEWFTVDPTASNNMDVNTFKYIDIMYNIDDNPVFPFMFWANDYAKIEKGISIFFPERNLHWQTGSVGYTVAEDKSPEYFVLQITYQLNKISLE